VCRRDLTTQTLTTDRHPCPRWDLNPQSQQTSDRRHTPLTARPVGPAINSTTNRVFFLTFIVQSIIYMGTHITSASYFGSAIPIPCHLALTLAQPHSRGWGIPLLTPRPILTTVCSFLCSRLESGHCLEYR